MPSDSARTVICIPFKKQADTNHADRALLWRSMKSRILAEFGAIEIFTVESAMPRQIGRNQDWVFEIVSSGGGGGATLAVFRTTPDQPGLGFATTIRGMADSLVKITNAYPEILGLPEILWGKKHVSANPR